MPDEKNTFCFFGDVCDVKFPAILVGLHAGFFSSWCTMH